MATSEEEFDSRPSELKKFAALFDSNWAERAITVYMIAGKYIAELPADRLDMLAQEFHAVFYDASVDSDRMLYLRWFEQGAQAWDMSTDIRAIYDFYCMMKPDAPECALQENKATGHGYASIGLVPRAKGGKRP